jgi:hypothetical protein
LASLEADKAKYRRLLVSMADFFEASGALNGLHFLKGIPDGVNKSVRWSLIGYAVVAYARPFKSNKTDGGQSTASVTRVDLGADLDALATAHHDRIIHLRDQVIAHSDFRLKPMHPAGPNMARGEPTFTYIEGIDLNYFRWLVSKAVESSTQAMDKISAEHGAALWEAR